MTTPIDFAANAARALRTPNLRNAFDRATTRASEARLRAAGDCPDWESWRERARAIKQEVLRDLESHVSRFENSVRRRGGTVHRASNPEDACRILLEIAKRTGVRIAIKSKSMTSEEIDLNDALEAAGIETVETDLGEYIIQLAKEKPSHIIAPAIHKTRGEIAGLFRDKLAADGNDDPQRLAAFARGVLREKFFRADLGISGANFGVAETGTVVIVENEGNARCCTTLPQVHVVLMGIEKVIPRLADLPVFLRLLPRSATGQTITSYVSLLTGPRRAGESDGPQELHVILLDHGRTRIQADPETRDTLACIRCGACLNVCPVYRNTGGHAYGWVYPGPIGAIVTPQLKGLDHAGDLPFASSLCGACRDACPVKIDIPRLLLTLRSRVVEFTRRISILERVGARLAAWLMTHPRAYRAAARLARLLLLPRSRNGWIRSLPPPLNAWTASRDFPLPAPAFFQERTR